MATFRKIDSRIWDSPDFSRLTVRGKLAALYRITLGRSVGILDAHAGPRFRVRKGTQRRPDLYSREWKATRLEVISEQGTICAYCDSDCKDDPTVDHINPVCAGGPLLDKSNLVVCCRACNSRKGGKEGWR